MSPCPSVLWHSCAAGKASHPHAVRGRGAKSGAELPSPLPPIPLPRPAGQGHLTDALPSHPFLFQENNGEEGRGAAAGGRALCVRFSLRPLDSAFMMRYCQNSKDCVIGSSSPRATHSALHRGEWRRHDEGGRPGYKIAPPKPWAAAHYYLLVRQMPRLSFTTVSRAR